MVGGGGVSKLLSELREPPVIGCYYMVPTVRYRLRRMTTDWPVIGPLHHDREHIKFDYLHYHLDGRFLARRLYDLVSRHWQLVDGVGINVTVLTEPSSPSYIFGSIPRRATLKRMMCKRPIQLWLVGEKSAKWGLQEAFGDEPSAIRHPDGRLLCPHRKADLSNFPADSDGMVTCPLHGLRVRCSPAASSPDAVHAVRGVV